MHELKSNGFHCLLAIAAGVCFLLAVRYATLTLLFVSAGRYPAAAGFLLVAGLSALCLACAVIMACRSRLSEWIEATLKSRAIAMTWLVYAMIAIPALIFSVPEGWDEARHIQYGMFLRGYDVSGEPLSWLAVRSPMASFLSALVFPFTQVINPVLFAALVALMIAWCRRYSHPALALFAIVLIVANDHFMQAIWAVMGELPGALFLVAAVYLLSRQRFALCALCLALAVLSRWNLAPIAVILVLFVAIRVSFRHALIMAIIGASIFGVWVLKSWIVAGPPWELLGDYATHAHEYTDSTGPRAGIRPTTFGRLDFYSAALYFQSLPALLAIPVSFFIPRSGHSKVTAELFRFWLPASLIVYFNCITLTGGYYPRLAVVTFPLSLLLLAEVIWAVRVHCNIAPRMILPIMLGLLPIGAASAVQSYDVVAMIGRKVLQPPPLPPSVAQAIREHTTRRDLIVMPRFYKISRQSDGRHLRVYTRRNILFFADLSNPSHELMFSRTLDDEIRDFEYHVDLFLERMPPEIPFLLPARYRDRVAHEHIVMEQDGWILGRAAERVPE